jgi:murein tripeptide amidase MpaA
VTYFNVVEVEAAVQILAQAYPATSRLITLPNPTAGNRTSHALQIGAGLPGTRDAIVLTGGVHAREWGGCEILVYLAADLLSAYAANSGLTYGGKTFTAQQVRSLVERVHIVVFPLVNPDGRHHSQTQYYMWRKNRQANACGHERHRGVDLNRNFDFLFDYNTAFSPLSQVSVTDDPCDDNETDVFQGTAAFSEPESRNVRWLLNQHTRTRWHVDVHSYGRTMMYSWGDDVNQSATAAMNFRNAAYDGVRGVNHPTTYGEYISAGDLGDVQGLAAAFVTALQPVRGTVYTAKPSFDLYPTSGAADDYTFSRHAVNNHLSKAYSFTLEFGSAFAEPWVFMREIVREVDAGLIGLCLAALATAAPPAQGGPPAQGPAPAQTTAQPVQGGV